MTAARDSARRNCERESSSPRVHRMARSMVNRQLVAIVYQSSKALIVGPYRSGHTAARLIAIAGVIALLAVGMRAGARYLNRRTAFASERSFDASAWRVGNPDTRRTMVRNLLRDGHIVGLAATEVRARLGPPSYESRTLGYSLGDGAEASFAFNSDWSVNGIHISGRPADCILDFKPFDEVAWKTASICDRLSMLDTAQSRKTLHGQSRDRIVAMFGSPRTVFHNLQYDLGHPKLPVGPSSGMCVMFDVDPDGVVTNARLTDP